MSEAELINSETVLSNVSETDLSMTDQRNLELLTKYFEAHIQEGIAIAFSGGVDSSLLLKIACDVGKKTGHKVLAITFETKLHPHGDLEKARELALSVGAIHQTIEVDEFADPEIMNNPIDRCYRCKHLLFTTLLHHANSQGHHFAVDGSNYDDLNAYRPGMRALKELGIHSPLLELSIGKAQIRSLAKMLGIPTSDRPSAPCLATRLPYGARLDFELLNRIDQGEQFIKNLGFYNVRLRQHQDILRIEIDKKDFILFINMEEQITKKMKELGFVYITMDLEGFRSGSMDLPQYLKQ